MPFLAYTVVLAADADKPGGSLLSFLLPLVILGGLFYFLLILPQRRRQRQMQSLRDKMQVGDEVRTIGGIYGRVTSMTDVEVVIDVGNGTTLRVARRAIAERLGGDAG